MSRKAAGRLSRQAQRIPVEGQGRLYAAGPRQREPQQPPPAEPTEQPRHQIEHDSGAAGPQCCATCAALGPVIGCRFCSGC